MAGRAAASWLEAAALLACADPLELRFPRLSPPPLIGCRRPRCNAIVLTAAVQVRRTALAGPPEGTKREANRGGSTHARAAAMACASGNGFLSRPAQGCGPRRSGAGLKAAARRGHVIRKHSARPGAAERSSRPVVAARRAIELGGLAGGRADAKARTLDM